MAISELSVQGYRSIRRLRLAMKPINLLVGPNGCGKSNLYRGIYLLAAAAEGRLSAVLAEEGGITSVAWAGARKKDERVRVSIAVTVDDFSYELVLGLPIPALSVFSFDPCVKEERLRLHKGRSGTVLLERAAASAHARDADGNRVDFPMMLDNSESCLSQLAEPHRFPALSIMRQTMLDWRFYHEFRTDAQSPMRRPHVAVRTPVMSRDGSDVAAAIQTIREIGDGTGLDEAVDLAFPGACLSTTGDAAALALELQMPGFKRPFAAHEMSDGTLRYICLLAALMSPRPPALIALNEPETSLHPDLIEPLAHLIVRASQSSQLWITTHSQPLADHIGRLARLDPVRLTKVDGETRVLGQGLLDM